jgi:hypothetical protein
VARWNPDGLPAADSATGDSMTLREETRKVTFANGPRHAGKPDECFYCNMPMGADHKDDCVCVKRKVIVRMTVEYPVEVPASWTPDNIHFHRNEGTWCSDNAVDELVKLIDGAYEAEHGCLCRFTKFKYVKEAE